MADQFTTRTNRDSWPRTDDHAAYAAHMNGQLGIELNSVQLSCGLPWVRCQHADLPGEGLHLSSTAMNQADFSEFLIPVGFTGLTFCYSGHGLFQNGRRVASTSLAMMPGGRRYYSCYPAGWKSLDLLLSDAFVSRVPALEKLVVCRTC